MKKTINLFLVMASLAAAGVVSSCKDYNEDLSNDFNNTISAETATLQDLLTKQGNDLVQLRADLAKLQSDLSNINSCECNIDAELAKFLASTDFNKKVKEIVNTALGGNVSDDIINLITSNVTNQIYNNSTYNFKDEVDKLIKQYLSDHKEEIGGNTGGPTAEVDPEVVNQYVQAYLNGEKGKNAIEVIMNTIMQSDAYKAKLQDMIDAYLNTKEFNNCVIDCATEIKKLQDADEALKALIAHNDTVANERIDSVINQLWGTNGQILDILNSITNLNDSVTTINSNITDIKGNITTIQGDVINLTNSVNSINNTISGIRGDINLINSTCTALKTSVDSLAQALKDERAWTQVYVNGEIDKAMDEVAEDIAVALDYATQYTDKMIANLQIPTVDLSEYLTGSDLEGYIKLEDLSNYVTFADIADKITLADLNEAIAASEAKMTEEISSLTNTVKGLSEDVSEIRSQVSLLTGRMNNVSARLNAQITNIIVQGVTTPMLFDASISLPIGLQSNILVAYHGSSEGGKFPKYGSILDADGNKVSCGESIDEWDFTSKAGKVYFTINPSNCDFSKDLEDKVLYLYDSQNNKSAVRLTNVKKSDKLLQFGLTRAADNGFYEADAVLDPENAANNALNIQKSDLKAVGKDIKNLLKNRAGIKDLAVDAAKLAIHATRMPAYAMGVPYRYTDDNNNETEAFVYSNYGLATIAIKPLTYNVDNLPWDLEGFAKQIPHKYINTISRLSDVLSGVTVKIKDALHFEFDKVDFNLEGFDTDITIEIGEIDLGTITLEDKTVTIDTDVKTDVDATVNKGELNMDVNTEVTATTTVVTVIVPIDYTYEKPKFKEDGKPETTEDGKVVYEQVPVHIEVPVDIPAQTITGTAVGSATNNNDVPVTGSATGHINETVTIPMEDIAEQINTQVIKKVNDAINDELAKVNVQLKKINDLTSSINKMSDQLNSTINDMLANTADNISDRLSTIIDVIESLEGRGDNVIDRINGYIERVNKLLDRVYTRIDNISYYMQPVLMSGISTSGVSQTASLPTYVKATSAGANYTPLHPTTFTAEVINPAYKKFVKVIAARDSKGVNHEDAVEFANKQKGMNKVIDGSTRSVVFGTDAKYAGLTYEIVYAALDYHGYQSTQHYYIKVIK